jgi:hypothetical protein
LNQERDTTKKEKKNAKKEIFERSGGCYWRDGE